MNLNQGVGGKKRLIEKDGSVYQALTVIRCGRAANSRPRIQIVGDWLPELGFASGVLVQSLPESNGLLLNLFNENINYSELYNETMERGGALNRLYISNTVTTKGPTLVTTGKHLLTGGLKTGDACIAKCEYGRIRVRKVTGNIRLINVARTKDPHTGEPVPIIFLSGDWLNDIGFTPDTLMTVALEPGCITLTAHKEAVVYSEIVKYARKNKMQLLQVSMKLDDTFVKLSGKRIISAGFNLGDIFAAEYEYGVIKLQKFDPQRFGFPESESPENKLLFT